MIYWVTKAAMIAIIPTITTNKIILVGKKIDLGACQDFAILIYFPS